MELSAPFRFRSRNLNSRFTHIPISHPFKDQRPFSTKLVNKPKNSTLTVRALRKAPIEGLSDELNAVARRNLDFAYTRRRVRDAFTEVHQQLDHCLFKNAPAGIRTEEWYERNSRGLEIFCKSWMPRPEIPLKASVCFCHGYGDTCTFFFEGIARRIAASGYGVFAMDYPGFGLSEGLHGYIPNFDYLVDDVIEHYTKIKARPDLRDLPRFILGQSMGGAVSLKVHLREPDNWDGMILVAPMCKIADDVLPSDGVMKVLTLLSKVMPKAKLFPNQELDELFFREPSKRKLAVYNVLCYDDNPRLRTGMELLRTTKEIESQVHKVSAPLLVLHGAEDKVTDPLVSKFLYEKASSKDKTLKLYEGGYHCILEGEPDDRISAVHDDIVKWLDFRSSSK
ncbi:caffeoylshikimate esterase-like [Vigna unguiculata]|uniref:Acylglycerol lipase n=1 Tax=Vigna unguiculata TaxID=3917 RepID=A0A4D6LNN0_VIGUN|nr:caffeoylshikimate esterase-like [Vigna unguiculata]QCD89975.1 acylglycerol lipase [Vigna unguiculata]